MNLLKLILSCAVFVPVAAASAGPVPPAPSPVTICTESDFWAPYSYMLDGEAAGLHIELTTAAFGQQGEPFIIYAMPWKRCLERAADGQFDALLGASFGQDRLADFYFPADAVRVGGISRGGISQLEYVAVVRRGGPAPAVLTLETMPEPVGVPLGYMAARTLRAAGKQVNVATKHADLFQMLARGRVGSVLVLRDAAENHIAQDGEGAALEILEPPIWSSSHFLVFSRKGQVDVLRAQRLWAAIAAVRDDTARMKTMKEHVNVEVQLCLRQPVRCH